MKTVAVGQEWMSNNEDLPEQWRRFRRIVLTKVENGTAEYRGVESGVTGTLPVRRLANEIGYSPWEDA